MTAAACSTNSSNEHPNSREIRPTCSVVIVRLNSGPSEAAANRRTSDTRYPVKASSPIDQPASRNPSV
jgi:hypothetical protein